MTDHHPSGAAEPLSGLLPPPSKYDRAITIASAIGLIAVFGYYLVYIFIRIGHKNKEGEFHYGDFSTFYHAALDVLAGRDPYIPFEKGALAYVYPPMLAVLYTPLTRLSQVPAARVMLIIQIGLVLLALFTSARELLERFGASARLPVLLAVAFMAAGLAENDMRGQLQALESDVLMLLSFVLALRWLDRRPYLAGLALAFAMNIKYLSIVFVPYLLLRRRWKAAAGFAVWSVVLALLPALLIGWNENMRCLKVALGGLLGWVGTTVPGATQNVHHLSDLVSISITSAIARALRDSGRSESWALVASTGIGVLIVLAAARVYRMKGLPFLKWPAAGQQRDGVYRGLLGIEWIGVMTVMLIFSPNTNTRHLSMTQTHYVAAAVLLLIPRAGVPRWPLLLGVLVMFIGFIMPIPKLSGREFTHQYFVLGVASWCLLFMYSTLFYTALCWVKAQAVKSQAWEPQAYESRVALSPSSGTPGEGRGGGPAALAGPAFQGIDRREPPP